MYWQINDQWNKTNNNIYIVQYFKKPQLLKESDLTAKFSSM